MEDSFQTKLRSYNSDFAVTSSSLDDSSFMSMSQAEREMSNNISMLARDFNNLGDAVVRDFVLKLMDFVLRVMAFVLKMMDFVLKLMDFAPKNEGAIAKPG